MCIINYITRSIKLHLNEVKMPGKKPWCGQIIQTVTPHLLWSAFGLFFGGRFLSTSATTVQQSFALQVNCLQIPRPGYPPLSVSFSDVALRGACRCRLHRPPLLPTSCNTPTSKRLDREAHISPQVRRTAHTRHPHHHQPRTATNKPPCDAVLFYAQPGHGRLTVVPDLHTHT